MKITFPQKVCLVKTVNIGISVTSAARVKKNCGVNDKADNI